MAEEGQRDGWVCFAALREARCFDDVNNYEAPNYLGSCSPLTLRKGLEQTLGNRMGLLRR